MGDLKHKADALGLELAAQQGKQQELDDLRSSKTKTLSSETQVNSDLRRDLMLKNQDIQTLQQEIAEFKRQGARLRQDNVVLNRFLPNRNIGGRFPQKDPSDQATVGDADQSELVPDMSADLKTVKLNVHDVLHSMECYNSSASYETELLRQLISQFGTLLRLIFKFYKGQLKQQKEAQSSEVSGGRRRRSTTVHGSHKSLTMKELTHFADDCGLASNDVNEEFTVGNLNEILVAMGVGSEASLSKGIGGTSKVNYQQFCELLVRVAIAKNNHRFAADRFAHFMEKEIFPTMDIKINKLMDEL